MNSVDDRKESDAEHCWSCLILADYFLNKIDLNINRARVYELLMYHDIVEIDIGDNPLHPENKKSDIDELEAGKEFSKKLPTCLRDKYLGLITEFEERKTVEAKFAVAIEKLDPVIHELDYKEDWKGWTKGFIIKHKEKYFEEFPIILETFHKLLKYIEKEGYFNQ